MRESTYLVCEKVETETPGGQLLLTVLEQYTTAANDSDPKLALIQGQSTDQADYRLEGTDADHLQLIFDGVDDPATDELEFAVSVREGQLGTQFTGPNDTAPYDSFYDFTVVMENGAVDPEVEVSARFVGVG